MKIHYVEIVTSDPIGVCAAYEATYAIKFGALDALLGGAKTAALPDGALVGVRAPLRDSEPPVVRPYWLVEDLKPALETAAEHGAFVALSSMEIPGKGAIAIYLQGGVDHGLWQL